METEDEKVHAKFGWKSKSGSSRFILPAINVMERRNLNWSKLKVSFFFSATIIGD